MVNAILLSMQFSKECDLFSCTLGAIIKVLYKKFSYIVQLVPTVSLAVAKKILYNQCFNQSY